MQHAPTTATGPAIPVEVEKAFAATQATWRFLDNTRVTFQTLVEPLRRFAREQITSPYVLAVVDWSKIDYKNHTAKKDTVQLTHKNDVGYELTTQLLVDTDTGRPLAPVQMHLKTAHGYLSTVGTAPSAEEHRLEHVADLMNNVEAMNLPARIVHVIDREADSVRHLRQWLAAGHEFIVRGDDRIVIWRDETLKYNEIEARLDAEGAFTRSRDVTIKGKPGVQYVCETEIILDRPAKRKINGRSTAVPGEAIRLRLVMARVIDPKTNAILSTWYLLSNLPPEVSAERMALWYYWRWDIESYFKLMKSGGQQLEHWQQESGEAVLKRLLVASMASAVVWSLQRLESVESREFKQVLVRLSGKSVKRGRAPTAGTLLSGLFVFLRIFDFLDHMNFDLTKIAQLKTLLQKLAPNLLS